MGTFIDVKDTDRNIVEDGKVALLFHIPGHCAGCKRVIESLKNRKCDGWTFILVNAEEPENKELVERYEVRTAPTIVMNQGRLTGLKDFLTNADSLFGSVFAD